MSGRDPDLAGAEVALLRAARKARERAEAAEADEDYMAIRAALTAALDAPPPANVVSLADWLTREETRHRMAQEAALAPNPEDL